jgi:hypothetical protein
VVVVVAVLLPMTTMMNGDDDGADYDAVLPLADASAGASRRIGALCDNHPNSVPNPNPPTPTIGMPVLNALLIRGQNLISY